MSSLIRGIIISHATLAEALISTVEQIAGRQENLLALSNTGIGNEELESDLGRLLDDGQSTVIFVDFYGGSTYAVTRTIVYSYDSSQKAKCAVVTGFNLPMLISFVTKRKNLSFDDLVETIRLDGHRGIQ